MARSFSSLCRLLDSGGDLSDLVRHKHTRSPKLVMESITELHVNLPRVVPVESAEGLAVVEVHAPVGYVQGIHRCGEALAEILANREIEGCVLWQMASRIRLINEGVTEAGTVVNVGGSKRSPGKS